MIRRIIEINREKCNGCGACAAACHEGAIAMVDGKAQLMRDDYCPAAAPAPRRGPFTGRNPPATSGRPSSPSCISGRCRSSLRP